MKKYRIGIIGAENSHSTIIGQLINIEKCCPGFSVDYIWGETKELASKFSVDCQCRNIVAEPDEMMGKIDALIVAHRHGKYHINAAKPFVEKGMPVFIDKPLSCDSNQAHEILDLAKKCNSAVFSHSILPMQKSFHDFIESVNNYEEISSVNFVGPADFNSQYGGLFFYGIHQVEMALQVFGYDFIGINSSKSQGDIIANLRYQDGKNVTIHFLAREMNHFFASVVGEGKAESFKFDFDRVPHFKSVQRICKVFRSGKTMMQDFKIIKPIEVLETIEAATLSIQIKK